VVVYVDAKSAGESAVGKVLAPLIKELPSQWGNLPGVDQLPIPSGAEREILQAVEGVGLAELVFVAEGEVSPSDSRAFTPNDSLLLVAKMTRVVEDQEGLIGRLLSLAENQQPGLSNRVAQTRRRAGAAELFEIPTEAFGDTPLPFPVSLAVGPGAGGSILAAGRTDRLKNFLAGQSSGVLPAKVDQLLPRRGQIWMYAAVPPEAGQAMAAGGSTGAEAMPMMGELSKSMEQMRDVALGLTLGNSGLDFNLALGFASGQAAQELKQGLDGMLGFMKMAASQNPSAASKSLQSLAVAAEGNILRLSTSVSLAELRQGVQVARQQMGLGPAGASSAGTPAQRSARVPEVKPLEDKGPGLELEFLGLLPHGEGHLRYGKLRVTNRSSKAVARFRVTYLYVDERGTKVGEWTRLQQDLDAVLVPAGATRELQVPLFDVPLRTANARTVLRRVEFTDGTAWP
jgi:hypothetical protein